MPIGMILWRWDYRSGAEELGKYPKELDVSDKTMMQLYSQHLYGAQSDIVSMYVGALNIISVWTGSTHNYFLSLLLTIEEQPEDYKEVISDLLYYLIPFIEEDTFNTLLPSIYQRCTEFPSTNLEQRRAMMYGSNLNRAIFKTLSEEGCFYRDELKIWLEDILKTKLYNFEYIIDGLVQNDILKTSIVRGVDGTYVFLLKYLICFRAPPLGLSQKIKIAKDNELNQKILKKIRDFFKKYVPNEQDNIEIAGYIRQTNYWVIIDFLRKSYAKHSSLTKLKLHGVDQVMNLVNNLINSDIVDNVVDQNEEQVYFLKSDIILDFVPMNYMINQIYNMHVEDRKPDKLLLSYISILKENYLESH